MKEQLLKYAERIDAMSLRERAMLFIAAVVVLVALIFNTLIDPLQAREKRLSLQISEQQTQTRALEAQLAVMAQPRGQSAEAANRDKAAQLRAQMAEINTMLAERERQFVKPQRVAFMIESMLKRNGRIALLSMQNLPVTALSETGTQANGGVQGVYRHGLDVSLRGSYPSLIDYLAMLEAMPEKVFWGGAELSADGQGGATLKLTLYTLSLEKSWLAI